MNTREQQETKMAAESIARIVACFRPHHARAEIEREVVEMLARLSPPSLGDMGQK
jgi:hypothetical protein